MLVNYIKISLRNIQREKGYSFINIAGLAVGMAVSMLILCYIRFELSYDAYHENSPRIYRVTRRFDTPTGYTPHFARCPDTWINNLPDEFPEIERLIRFQYEPQVDLRIGENKLRTYRWFSTDAGVFEVFSFALMHGDYRTALGEPNSVVLTENMALNYFGSTDIVGEQIILLDERAGVSRPYTITGIMNNVPANSHFQIDFLASYPHEEARQGWAWVYLLIKPDADPALLEGKFPAFIEKYSDASNAKTSFLHLQPLRDIHLRSHLDREIEPNGDIRYIYIFAVVALLVMLIACFNFMNLSTARSMRRAREIGIRKVLGAHRRQLIGYFLHESMLFSFFAFICAVILVILIFPLFNAMLDNKMQLSVVYHWSIVIGLSALCLGTGLFAGSYPALVISAFRPIHSLSGGSTGHIKRLKFGVRRALVVLQFTMSILLMICTLISTLQFSYLSNAKLGMREDQIIAIRNIPYAVRGKYPIVSSELAKYPGISEVSAAMEVPSRDILDAGFCRLEGMPAEAEAQVLAVMSVDANYIDFMEIEVLAGRSFDTSVPFELPGPSNQEDGLAFLQSYIEAKKRTYLINESALKALGWHTPEEALGKRIDWRNAVFHTQYGEIIGVVADYHYTSLRQKIRPLLIMNEPLFLSCILVKINTEDIKATLAYVENTWDRLFPDFPMQYDFVDDLFADLYRAEQRQGRILGVFSTVAIFIAYLGLFGLASFTAEQRTREIGIRKVAGASVTQIVVMLLKEFTKWVIFAACMAAPLAYWAMHQWLRSYAYHIIIPWWPFFLAAGIALVIAILTVSYQSVRAALSDPVTALRYE